MIEKDTIKLLRECDAGMKMAAVEFFLHGCLDLI